MNDKIKFEYPSGVFPDLVINDIIHTQPIVDVQQPLTKQYFPSPFLAKNKFDRIIDDLVEDNELPDFQTSVERTDDNDLEIIKYNDSLHQQKERSFEDILLNITG